MKTMTFSDGSRTFTRISKPTAKKAFNQGLKIGLIPHKCNPCGAYMSAFVTAKSEDNSDFVKLVNNYSYYSCQYNELGKYPAFYNEYKETYKNSLKAYPDLSSVFSEDAPANICLSCFHYKKSGSRWVETDFEARMIDCIFYTNIVDPNAIRFFRNLGGYERVIKNYTKFGFIPVEVISINPSRTEKTVYRFKF